MRIAPLSGITERTVGTRRTTTRVLSSGSGAPVLFLHDSPASATFWEESMLALPSGFRGIAPDLRGHGLADPDSKISAVNNVGDMVEDVVALMEEEGISYFIVVGHGWGGSIAWRLMMDYPERVQAVVVVNPYSPFGLGGTKDVEGTPVYADFAGSGAALAKTALVEAITRQQRPNGNENVTLPALMHFFNAPPKRERVDALLAAIYSVKLGPSNFPGDQIPSLMWPRSAPGVWGPLNSLSPMFAEPVNRLYGIRPKPPVLWIRGAADPIVSDESVIDPAIAGKRGEIEGYPGEDVYPPQPMVSQTRAVLERYAEAGGLFHEVIIEDVGHTPFIEAPDAFNKYFHEFLGTLRR